MDPLLRAWECFREEIRDILGSCARTTNSKSKITCSQWKSASSATWNTHLFQPGPNLLNCWMIKCLYFEMLLSFWDCKLLAGSACRGGLAFCGSGEDFFQTVSPCLFAIVSIISLGSWIAYFAKLYWFLTCILFIRRRWPPQPQHQYDNLQLSWWEKLSTMTHDRPREISRSFSGSVLYLGVRSVLCL